MFFLTIAKHTRAEGTCPTNVSNNAVSIYNIREGTLILGPNENSKAQIKHISDVLKDFSHSVSNWNVKYGNGYVTFENQAHPKNCLTYGGKNKQLALRTCEDKKDQFFELLPTSTGANLIKAWNVNQCVYHYNGWFGIYVYSGACPGKKAVENKWLWGLIPAYSIKDMKLE